MTPPELATEALDPPHGSGNVHVTALRTEEKTRDAIFRYFRLHLSADEAERHWQAVRARHQHVSAAAGGGLDIRATAFDYFLKQGLLVDPVVVEEGSLRETEILAYHDRLTGLHNFAYFDAEIRMEVARARRYGGGLALVLVDLDAFKAVNDGYGHQRGNDVLAAVSELLRRELRTGDLVARIGGDEFALLLHHADLMTGVRIAARKRAAIERWFQVPRAGAPSLAVTASLGVAALSPVVRNARELFETADRALYRAKREGRNRLGFPTDNGLVTLGSSAARRLLETSRAAAR